MSIDVTLSESFQPELQAAVQKMEDEGLDIYEMPGSCFRLLRQDSDMAREMMNKEPVEDLLIPVEVEGKMWIITL